MMPELFFLIWSWLAISLAPAVSVPSRTAAEPGDRSRPVVIGSAIYGNRNTPGRTVAP